MSDQLRVKILYMEDEPGLARLFLKRLQRAGYEVDLASDGEEGLSKALSTPFDVLVVDHKLPKKTGLDVIRSLADSGPIPPTIMVTGAGDETIAVEALKLGAADYIVKDVEARYLELMPSVIRQALERRRLVEEREQARLELQKAHDELEIRVKERTAELEEANEKLRHEIKERRKAEEEAKQSEERFRTIFELARDCVFIKDKSLRYTLVNPSMEDLLQKTASWIVGRTDGDIYGDKAAEHLKDVDERVLKGDVIEEEHTRPVRGMPVTFLDTRVPMRNTKGDVVGICGIARNITDRTHFFRQPQVRDLQYPSKAIRSTLAAARLAAQTDSIILLTGESGSGKDYLAGYIHDHSNRSGGPFYAINCAAVAPELAESELFGHEAGAFTGAGHRKKGMLELAEGGTILLNEIGELHPPLQAKLLTFLDTRMFTRVGGERNISVNARLLAATNKDLEQEVAVSRFRGDLFYRLNVFSIRVPPLRERTEDIPILMEQLLAKLTAELQLPGIPEIEPGVTEKLCRYSWPGNVRELRNVLERSLILSGQGPLRLEMLGTERKEAPDWQWATSFPPEEPLNDLIKDLKRALIRQALEHADGKRNRAAQLLGITRDALKRQMTTLGFFGSD